MTEYRFRVLDAEKSIRAECFICAASDDEAREIATELVGELTWPLIEVTQANNVICIAQVGTVPVR